MRDPHTRSSGARAHLEPAAVPQGGRGGGRRRGAAGRPPCRTAGGGRQCDAGGGAGRRRGGRDRISDVRRITVARHPAAVCDRAQPRIRSGIGQLRRRPRRACRKADPARRAGRLVPVHPRPARHRQVGVRPPSRASARPRSHAATRQRPAVEVGRRQREGDRRCLCGGASAARAADLRRGRTRCCRTGGRRRKAGRSPRSTKC